VAANLNNQKKLKRSLERERPVVRSHHRPIYQSVWVVLVVLTLATASYSFITGEFHTSTYFGLLVSMGICCALQASNDGNANTIAEILEEITRQIFLEKMILAAIAALQLIAPKTQLPSFVVHAFGQITSTPQPSIEKISANTPLHFAS
jgi:hypothetical protein